MTIIFGGSTSGKSSTALRMIKNVKKAIYFVLDSDKSVIEILDENKIEFKSIQDPFIIDLEMYIMGRSDISHIVIDPINYIKQSKQSSLKYDKSVDELITGLEYLENKYKLEIIAIFNTLNKIDSTTSIIKNYKSKHNIIPTKETFTKTFSLAG